MCVVCTCVCVCSVCVCVAIAAHDTQFSLPYPQVTTLLQKEDVIKLTCPPPPPAGMVSLEQSLVMLLYRR